MIPPAPPIIPIKSQRQRDGRRLAATGVGFVILTIVADMVLHVLGREELPKHLMYVALVSGAIIGWWGFFWMDSKRAKDGGTFVLDARERIHAHRRSTDPVIPAIPSLPESEKPDASIQ